MSFRSDSLGPSALRINVIGNQTAEPESANPYTVYRTVSTHGGQCYERLVRYSEFLWFYKRLKFTDKNKSIKTFPKKKWTRKKSMEDEVIEARQVMLNEFMRDVCRSELTPESEQCLFKLLKMGKYDDGCGRVSELRGSLGASFLKSNRGDRSARRGPLDVVHEDDEEGDKVKPTTELAAAATLTATSVSFPAISSNATTVFTEEERSAIRSFRADDFPEGESSGAIVLSEESSASTDGDCRENPRSAPHKSVSSIPPSSYSAMVLDRPQLKASQSLPSSRRSKHVGFPNEPPVAPVSATVKTDDSDVDTPENDGSISPEKKYRDRINTHLSTISRLLSESETETEDLESARSIQTIQSVPLTA